MDEIQSEPNQRKATPPPPTPPQPLHQSDADEEDENVKQLDGCASHYLSMQECIANSNRDWKACQAEVQALKACMEKRRGNK
ncbi:cytochrome c oxidase assembly factor 4 homolog, mitochondrial [Neltuma alba]|uniref:cytochrome c oxidase assembly factor 4 homolog, mitochondrial n=1 Tax=Neltuma alba TaxID=207710 RepID=UPI0010A4231A|nr:cytochrome c oxidase assembly factor 4 homolog, mitochondrial [Prosopis alba]